ncbi:MULTISPECIES: PQQ-binding-like beta-propeller repeat protein [Sphingobacterium]|uniref:outer membrane protein assembly factor BamB family protein n=1 Tax=Sphingobacterium TaxID=28453 RepID=UPI0013D9BD7B|nr:MULTISPECIES: PQQ-binding-like beta-propeller repeat protein [unclassified Sphingobacterium]
MKYIVALGLLFTFTNSFAQIKGRVYEDTNGNSKFDANERTLDKVVVSNGYQVVCTDAQGEFNMENNPDARFVFVKAPSGFKMSKQHYLKIEGQQTTYDLGVVVDPSQQVDRLDFIQITDTETALYGTWVDNIKQYARNQGIPLIMHTGDICYEEGMKFHARQLNSGLMGTAVHYAVGNHDLVKGKYGEELFEQLFGPTYYSFEKGPVHFVVTPMWSGDYAPSYNRDQVIRWMKKDLLNKDPNKALVLINHDFSVGTDFVLKGKTEEIDLKAYGLKAWLYGHWHNNYSFVNAANGVRVISTNAPDKGGIDHSVGQFLHVSMDKNGVQDVRPIFTNLKEYIVLADPIIGAKEVQIKANIYDSERWVNRVKLTGYNAKGNKVVEKDFEGNGSWTWSIELPRNKSKEIHEVLVEVIFGDGSSTMRKHKLDLKQRTVMKTLWSSNIGGGIWKVSPLLNEGMLYTATFDDTGGGKAKIVAMDVRDGSLLWELPVKNSIKQKLHIYKDILLATDVEGTVYAIDAKKGTLKWTKALRQIGLPNYVTGSALKDGVYYAGAGSFLTALNAESGEVVWKNTDWNGGEAMPGEMLVTEDLLITGANWNALFVHDRASGKLLWKKNEDGLRFRSGGVAVDGDRMYLTGLNTLFVLDKSKGTVLAQQKHALDFKVMGAPLIRGKQFVTGTSDAGVCGFDRETLEEKWRFDTRDALIFTSSYSNPNTGTQVETVESAIVPYQNDFIFGASDGYLYRLSDTGKRVAEKRIGAPVLADPALLDNLVFVADFSGTVHCIQLD